ncbi:MAG: recombinase family protein [Planctomycetota bacterium]
MERLCGLYARVSTERQSEVRDGSLDTQIDRLKQYVKFRSPSDNWKIIDVYCEKGKSGKNTERPEYQRLISDIKSGRINAVVCTKLDRITRSLVDFYKLMEIFTKHHVDFISLQENFDTSQPMGKAMLKMTLVWAELEREQTSLRTKEKMQWRAEQGLWNGGQVLGYDLVDKKLIVNEKEAKLVRLMFKKYLELGSVLQVVEWLNSHGYRTKEYVSNRRGMKRGGKRFFNANVLQKLTSRTYIGEVEHDRNIYPGMHKAIIDRQLWDEANKLIKMHAPRRVNPKRKVKHVFILQGLLKCGWCNSYMSNKYSTGRKELHYYYQCTRNSHGGNGACSMKYVPAPEIEKAVLKKLKGMSVDKKLIGKIVKEANKSTESTLKSLLKDRRIQENKLLPIKDAVKNIVAVISKGKGMDKIKSLSEELKELELQKDQIEKDINVIDFEINQVRQQVLNAKIMHESLTNFSQIYESATPLELKELLPRFVERITWKPTEIEIALFNHEVQRGQLDSSVTTKGSGALQVNNWLPGLDSNQRHRG